MTIDTAALLRDVDLVAVASNYTKLTRKGREYVGLCPFHADKNPSFHVIPHKGFAHCMACKWNGDAIDLVCHGDSVDFREACKRLGASDFKPDENRRREMLEHAPTRITLPPPHDARPPGFKTRHWGEPTKVWHYRDGEGHTLFYVARYEWVDDDKKHKATPQWTWGSLDGGESWAWGMGHYHEPRPLYGLDVLAQNPNKPVCIVEGEKAADAVRELLPMYAGVTWPGGTNGVVKVDWSPLKGRRVLIWPDQDRQRDDDGNEKPRNQQPGYSAAVNISHALADIGAAEIKIIDPSGTAHESGWDAADALAEGWNTARVIEWAKARASVCEKPADLSPPADIPSESPNDDRPEPPKPEMTADEWATLDDGWPFRALGFDRGKYFYMSRATGQISCLTAGQHRREYLISLASVSFYELQLAPSKKGADWPAAANAMMRACEAVGVYAGNENVRGRGAWLDDSRSVFHMGDKLLVDGAFFDPSKFPSRYIYEQERSFNIKTETTATNKQANALLEICRDLRWEQPISAYLLAGWLVCAPVCGILKWRPHVWLTGPSGSGKSTVVQKIAEPIISGVGRSVSGPVTAAGIMQRILRNDARPLLVDEAEPKDPANQARLKAILDLARIASSGGSLTKGTADQTGTEYAVRAMFMFASINPAIDGQADENRITQLALVANDPRDDEERAISLAHYESLMRKISDTITPAFADALLMRTLQNLGTLQDNAATFSNAAAAHLGNMRLGDQLGPMLAGAHLLHSLRRISYDDALKWIKARDWSQHTAAEGQRDSDRLIAFLMQYPVRFAGGNGGQMERTLGELLAAAYGEDSEGSIIPKDAAYETVLRHGIKPDGAEGVAVSTTHNAIKRALYGTEWAMGWRRGLMGIPGARTLKAARFGPGSPSPAVWIPRSAALG